MARLAHLVAIVAIAALVGGCGITSTVETSRQLEDGDMVLSTNFGWPGYLFLLPRVKLLAMYGVGDHSDINVHAGLNRTSVNAGMGGRIYPADWLTVGINGDIERLGAESSLRGVPVEGQLLTTVTPRIITPTDDFQTWYGGVESNILFNFGDGMPEAHSPFFAHKFGVVGGFDYLFTKRGLHAEIALSLISFDHAVDDGGLVPSAQFTVGGYLYNPFH